MNNCSASGILRFVGNEELPIVNLVYIACIKKKTIVRENDTPIPCISFCNANGAEVAVWEFKNERQQIIFYTKLLGLYPTNQSI